MAEQIVLDASAMVDLLVRSAPAQSIAARLQGNELHVPAHFDAEVLSALGRLHRAAQLDEWEVSAALDQLVDAPFERHAVATLVVGAWRRRGNLRLVDALYVELAAQIGARIVTTDARLAAAGPYVENVTLDDGL